MDFTFTAEQRAFQQTVRDFLAKESPPEHVRAMTTDPAGRSPKLWKGLASLGVVGLTVPEEYGGLGGDETDLVLILEEAGRAALPEPLVETTAVAVPLLRDAGGDLAAEWLPKIASGDAIVVVGGLDGATVTDAHAADAVLFAGETGVEVRSAEDVAGAPLRSVDATRRVFSLDEQHSYQTSFNRGAFATAAVLCGITARVIEMGAAYAKERQQFGKAIGSFQAVKHLLSDALLALEFARPVVYRAAWSLDNEDPDRSMHVSMGKAYASDAAMDASRAALQVFGAIGYTHEHDLHLWLNKATALAHAWGTATWHRDRVAGHVLGPRR
ncbi:MAG: acyl-CoA dehydrogenase family protein [Actinomycetota bacterium]